MNLKTADWNQLQELLAKGTDQILTVVDGKPIDALHSKFLDVVLTYELVCEETQRYVAQIEREHPRCGPALEFSSPLSKNAQTLQNITRIVLGAYTVVYQSFVDQLRRRLTSEEAHRWLKKRREAVFLESMQRLRNMDTHNEPLQAIIGTRFLIKDVHKVSDDEHHSHLHWDLRHQGVGFALDALAQSSRFQKPHIGLLTDKPIVNLLHDGIHELVKLVSEAIALGYLEANVSEYTCPCVATQQSNSVDADGDASCKVMLLQ